MTNKRILSLILGLMVLAGVALAIWWSSARKTADDANQLRLGSRVKVRIVSGSEKIPLLTDPRFVAAMERQGLLVEARKSGSREIATRADLGSFDVAFPAGQPAAAKIREVIKTRAAEAVLVTPMVIASWQPIADVLGKNGIVEEKQGAWWVIDMERLLRLMDEDKRWRDLPDNQAFSVGRSVLVATTDVRTSNSAAQFLALLAYLMNGRNVVTDPQQAADLAERVAPFFLKQGFQENSSAGPFEDYLSIGMGKVPLVWIYEAQYLEQALRKNLRHGMVLLYPQPTVFSKHVAVALSDAGVRFIAAMRDPEVMQIAADYGYRVEGDNSLRDKLKKDAMVLPDIIDIADVPTHDLLEHMIQTIETRFSH